MQQKEVIIIVVVLAAAFLFLKGGAITGFQSYDPSSLVYEVYSPPVSSRVGSGIRLEEKCNFYGDDFEAVLSMQRGCALAKLDVISQKCNLAYTRSALTDINIPEPETFVEGFYITSGSVAATCIPV